MTVLYVDPETFHQAGAFRKIGNQLNVDAGSGMQHTATYSNKCIYVQHDKWYIYLLQVTKFLDPTLCT